MNIYSIKFNRSKRLGRDVLFFLISFIIVGLTPAVAATEMTTIKVLDEATIEDADVLLGQIAVIEGSNAHLVDELKRIVISKSPLPGQSRQFDRRDLIKRLEQYNVDFSTVRLVIPQKINIIRGFMEIGKPEIGKIVSDFITQNTAHENSALHIKEINLPESVILPNGHVTYKVEAPRNRRLMGRCPLAVEFNVNGHAYKKVWATATIEVLGTVVVTRKPLGRFKPITEDDIVLQTLDLANLPDNVVTDPETVLGKRTKRAIGAQTPLRADVVELPPLVKRGDIVMILAESRGLKITAQGQVKKKGRLGERIPVVNVGSKKIVYARVIDSNTVKVDFQ
jgi:flagellar basal body P-ring formation protein FlgA